MDTRRIPKSKTFETRRNRGSGGVCLAELLFAEPGFRGTEIAAKHCHAERRLELSFAMREQVEASRGLRSRDTATGSSYEAVPLGPLLALSYWVELPDAAWRRTMCRGSFDCAVTPVGRAAFAQDDRYPSFLCVSGFLPAVITLSRRAFPAPPANCFSPERSASRCAEYL